MRPRHGDKSGVALIIVLGLLAILLVVCVSFAISMRVERAGVGHLRHAAMARHLVNGAMATAIAALDAEVGDDAYPAWHSGEDLSSPTYSRSGGKYWSETFSSYDNVAGEHVPARFFSSEVERYFPSGTAFKGYATRYLPPGETIGGDEVKAPEWIPVYGDTSGSAPSLLGRYAFFIMNTSDMLDISSIGHTNRWMGSDPGEIQLFEDFFPREVLDASALMDDIRDAGRYESFAEFNALADGSAITNVRSFTTFSYEPADTNKVPIGGSAADLRTKKKDIIKAFYDCGLQAGKSFGEKDCEQARWAYLGLIDFVDDNDKMEDDDEVKPWERPATENMPLPSGFIANLIVECREILELDEDDVPLKPKNDRFKMKIKADFKMPFVYPFVETVDIADFDLYGKSAVSRGPAYVEDVFGDTVPDAPAIRCHEVNSDGTDDNSVYGEELSINYSEEEVKIARRPPENSGIPPNEMPPSLDGLDVLLHAAAATMPANDKTMLNCQHCYPANVDDYGGLEEEDGDYMSWMTVSANFKDYGVELPSAHTDSYYDEDDPDEEVELKIWRTNIVVWAELLDPRFSARVVSDLTDWDDPTFYRPSHMPNDVVNPQYHTLVPVTKLNGQIDGFEDFEVALPTEDDFNADDLFGGYFATDPARDGSACPGGASPLASYILTHPSVASDVYMLNMDGTRVSSDEDSETTDTARMKWRAYVKNQPLESVGELGYLPIGIWQTIRLYNYDDNGIDPASTATYRSMVEFNFLPSDLNAGDPPFHPVFEKFKLKEGAVKGRVNINSLSKSSLASVFYKLPVVSEKETCRPYSSGAEPIGKDYANYLADAILLERTAAGGSFQSVTNLCNIFNHGQGVFHLLNGPSNQRSYAANAAAYAMDPAGGQANFGEFEREAIIRNSAGLFTTRGQSFIIAARGESYSPVFGKTSVEGGSVNASKTAIAQIWRDSVTNQWGRHPVVIQFFKIIDD